jgi:hypothetical protein
MLWREGNKGMKRIKEIKIRGEMDTALQPSKTISIYSPPRNLQTHTGAG